MGSTSGDRGGEQVVWVLLCAYNEAENLPGLLADLEAVARRLPLRVLVVDDGSEDGTGEVARGRPGLYPLEVVSHGHNRGLGAALRTGLTAILDRCRDGDVVVTMDADGSHRPAQIPQLVEALRQGADVVIASRYRQGSRVLGVPFLRRLLSLGARAVLSLRFPFPGVRDYTSGYRAYRAGLLRRAWERYREGWIRSSGFAAAAEILLTLRPFRPVVREVPLDLRYDLKRGVSKLPPLRTIRHYLRFLMEFRP
ncbi:MAG: glycosyltransferase [Armatimonadota bacterium]|nr:glycosyltransferase [Armatimonadota bacterium]MDR7443555.1 glycosyltransferase [Armatimonadota bacterium]MDR7570949.1 glycosyltransferase [Armatimonadota bacterium]MDR7615053.1 glycosyltransferase [Armatimonadota bacterium]